MRHPSTLRQHPANSIAYINPSVTVNRSVLNWTSVSALLKNQIAWNNIQQKYTHHNDTEETDTQHNYTHYN